jgi:hypothetical protein
VNGHVYVGTKHEVDVYGLLPPHRGAKNPNSSFRASCRASFPESRL